MTAPVSVLGLGLKSSLWYLERIHVAYAHSPDQTAPVHVNWVDFSSINAHLPDAWEHLLPEVERVMQEFAEGSNGALLVPNITLHQALDRIDGPWSSRLIHALDLPEGQGRQAAVYGTRHTHRLGHVSNALQKSGWKVVPVSEHATGLADQVRTSAYAGGTDPAVLRAFASELVRTSATATPVIACTELSMALSGMHLEGVLDLACAQIDKAVALLKSKA